MLAALVELSSLEQLKVTFPSVESAKFEGWLEKMSEDEKREAVKKLVPLLVLRKSSEKLGGSNLKDEFSSAFKRQKPLASPPTTPTAAGPLHWLALEDIKSLVLAPSPSNPGPDEYISRQCKWAFERYFLLLLAALMAAVVVIARYGNAITLNFSTAPLDATVLPPLVAAASFIMGSVLSNVMADFKEAEKVPAEMVGYFQCLLSFALSSWRHKLRMPFVGGVCTTGSDTQKKDGGGGGGGGGSGGGDGNLQSTTAAAKRTSAALADLAKDKAKPALQQLEIMLLCVMGTIDEDVKNENGARFACALPAFEEAFQCYCEALPEDSWNELETPQHAQLELVKKWARMIDISYNSIALPAYTLMDTITLLMCAGLVFVRYKDLSETSGYWACGIFATIVIYLNLLVRHLEDPFNGQKKYWLKSYKKGGLAPFVFPWLNFFTVDICNVQMERLVSK